MTPMTRGWIPAALLAILGLPSMAQRAPSVRAIAQDIRPSGIERTIRTLVSFGTRNTLSAQDDRGRGIGAARDWLYSEFYKLREASGGRLVVETQSFIQPVGSRIPVPTKLTNIVATLPGDLPPDRQRYVIVSGHYDSICSNPTDAVNAAPGANDDASGCAAVLEMARAMVPFRFRATLVFLCVAGEEQGLYGSTYFAEQAKLKGWRLCMLDNDIIGGTLGGNGVHDDRSVRVFSEGIPSNETESEARVRRSVGGEEDSPSRQLARYIQECARRFVPGLRVTLISRRDRYLRGGDHIPFNERGYPAVRFTEPNEDYHHQHQNVRTEGGIQYGDLPEFVDFPYVANVARVNAAAMASLALAPDSPRGAGLVTSRLTPDTDLVWAANTEPAVTGYEIVWRETTSPDWNHVRAVGNVTKITMKGLSKDNYLFGIRAVDAHGHRSPVAFPRPVR